MMAYAIKALHEQHPDKYTTDVDVTCREIFENNPYITPLEEGQFGVQVIDLEYPNINHSNEQCHQFVNAFIDDMSNKLHIKLRPIDWAGALYISDEEASWWSAVYEALGHDPPFWIINAGHKSDYTAKAWDFLRYQQIVERFPEVTFVQIGAREHRHPDLHGPNLLNFVGKTDLRQLIRLVWHSYGVITPVSLPMHLAYALHPHPRYNRKSRACIVISGGREPNHWQAAANQHFLHTCGMLDCCDLGGCWSSRIVPLNDGDEKDNSLCLNPIKLPSGQVIPKCLDMISVDDVCNIIKKYMDNLPYKDVKETKGE